MAGNAHRGAMACLNDAGFRDTLRHHNTDRAYVSRNSITLESTFRTTTRIKRSEIIFLT